MPLHHIALFFNLSEDSFDEYLSTYLFNKYDYVQNESHIFFKIILLLFLTSVVGTN